MLWPKCTGWDTFEGLYILSWNAVDNIKNKYNCDFACYVSNSPCASQPALPKEWATRRKVLRISYERLNSHLSMFEQGIFTNSRRHRHHHHRHLPKYLLLRPLRRRRHHCPQTWRLPE